jgi:hypothetical protein
MQKFEYQLQKYDASGFLGGKVDLDQMDIEFNRLGRDGWELVSIFDTNAGHGESRWIVATFKRPTAIA